MAKSNCRFYYNFVRTNAVLLRPLLYICIKWRTFLKHIVQICKAQNYTKETMYWVKSVKHWIECTSEAEIAEHSGNGIKRKNIDKSKIFLFVLGRNHGNYSGEKLTSERTVWAQWFQLLQCRLIMPKDFTINVNDLKIKKWLGAVVGKESEDLTHHDKWPCKMYPRLKLLHRLLRVDLSRVNSAKCSKLINGFTFYWLVGQCRCTSPVLRIGAAGL